MVIRKIPLNIFAILFFVNSINAQISESCDCTVDTLGLKAFLSTLTLNENQPLAFEVLVFFNFLYLLECNIFLYGGYGMGWCEKE